MEREYLGLRCSDTEQDKDEEFQPLPDGKQGFALQFFFGTQSWILKNLLVSPKLVVIATNSAKLILKIFCIVTKLAW